MKELKRVFALLMCLAIIGGDVRYVGAAEITDDQTQVNQVVETTEQTELDSTATSLAEETSDVIVKDVVTSDITENVAEEIASDASSVVETVTADETSDAKAVDAAETVAEEKATEATEESDDLLKEEITDEIDNDEAVTKKVEDYIDVDDNGTLILKDVEVGIPMGTIIIPLEYDHDGETVYLKAIPNGIFENDLTVKNISFNPDQESRLVSISANAFYNSSVESFTLPAVHEETKTIDGKDEKVPSEYVIKKIAADTFKNSSLKSIAFNGQPVEVIEKCAFQGSDLEKFIAPTTLKTIEDEAFSGCDKLATADLSKVETIGNDAFFGCKVLGVESGSLVLGSRLETIGDRAFKNCGFKVLDISTARNVTSVGDAVFENCLELTEFTFPSYFPCISDGMFRNCAKLVNVVMNDTYFSWGYIGKEAFYGCKVLTGNAALVGKTKMKRIVIPASIYSIGQRAFMGCTALKAVEIHYLRNYSEEYMFGIAIDKTAFEEIGRKFTIGGYDRSVESFANEHRFVFVDLSDPQEIEKSFNNVTKVEAYALASDGKKNLKPKAGDEVTLAITMGAGYTLVPSDNGRFVFFEEWDKDTKEYKPFSASKVDNLGLRLTEVSGQKLTFKFYMPGLSRVGNKLKLSGVLEKSDAHKTDEQNVKFNAEPYGDSEACTFNTTDNNYKLTFKGTGDRAQLKMTAGGRELGPWKFDFSVPDDYKNICSVSPEGIITAKTVVGHEGIVYAKNKATGVNHQIKVIVNSGVIITSIDFAIDGSTLPYPYYWYTETRRETIVVDPTTGETKVVNKDYYILELAKSSLAVDKYTFTAYARPHAADSEKVCIVDTTWGQTDANIASVGKAPFKVSDCARQITVQKGAVGETEITVSAENPSLAEKDPKRICQSGFIVKIVDDEPKLTTSNFEVIVNYSGGYKLPLVVADGYPIENDKLWIGKGKNGSTVATELYVEARDGDFYLKVANSEKIPVGTSKTYTNYWLCGEIFTNKFAIPIESVVASNIEVNNQYNMQGEINLFYSTLDGFDKNREKSGKVIVTPQDPIAKVSKYYLFTKENHRRISEGYMRPQDILDDEFANNFGVEIFDEVTGGAAITRTSNPIKKNADEKMYKSGYLYTMYEGFDKPVVNTITIPTVTVAPKYAFNAPKQVIYKDQKKQDFSLMVFSQKAQNLPIVTKTGDDGKDYYEYYDPLAYAESVAFDKDSSKGTTPNLFDESELKIVRGIEEEFRDVNHAGKKVKVSVNKIYMKLAGLPSKGKGVVNIYSPEWTQPLKLTVNVASTSAIAKTKLEQKNITLNTNANETVSRIKVTTNQKYANITDVTAKYSGSAKLESGGKLLEKNISFSISENSPEGVLTVSLPAGRKIEKGKYKFKVYTQVEYSTGDYRELKPVLLTVTVSEVKPTLKLKTASATLNAKYPGTEVNEIKFSIGNMPKGEYALDFSDVTITPKTKKGDYLERVRKSISFNYIPKVETENYKKDAVATVGFKKGTEAFGGNFSYQYVVSGAKAIDEDGKEVKLNEFKIKIVGKATEPKITVSKKGSINPIDPYTNIVATAKIAKIKANIEEVEVVELDSHNEPIPTAEHNITAEIITQEKYDAGDYKNMPNIKVTKGQVAPNQVLLRWKHSQGDQPKDTDRFKIQLYFQLNTRETGKLKSTTDIIVKPVQKTPILFAKLLRPYSLSEEFLQTKLYARSSDHRDFITRVVPVSPSTPIVKEVRLDDSTPDKLRRAYELEYYRVEPDQDDKNTYRVCDLTGIVKTVTLDAKKKPVVKVSYNSVSYNGISANEIYKYAGKTGEVDPEDIPVDFTDELAIELVQDEVKYRASFLKDQVYLIGNGHYYIHVTLINPAPITYDKEMDLKIEVRYFNQMKNKAGSKFTVKTTVHR